MYLLPILWATAAVVPEPRKESKTRSPGSEARSKIRSTRRSGLGVAKTSSGLNCLTSLLASWLCPTSSKCQMVLEGTPCLFKSHKNVFLDGIDVPSFPNQISPFSSIRRRDSAEYRGKVPGGGV